jgi:hypothetical protein
MWYKSGCPRWLKLSEMDPEQFSVYRHEAVHELMRLNDLCEQEFHISSWPRWDYDSECGTLTFSQDGVPKVLAWIQVVGTTSISGGTWMWGWANESLPLNVAKALARVRAFGEAENIAELKEAELSDDEYLGWGMTAVAAKVLGAKGAYRCPGENGFVYVIYSSIGFAKSEPETALGPQRIECADHGTGFAAHACAHLVSNPDQLWFSREADEEHKWPDAWCAGCDAFFQEQGEWNERNESKITIELLCHHCYERLRSRGKKL